jgi:small subunit ribosomal protein S8
MYYDLLPKIKNAARAQKDKMIVPFSRMDFAVATALVNGGYMKSVEKEMAGKRNVIVMRLAYKDKRSAVNDFKTVSKPSRHYYVDYRSLRPVKQGHGLGVISTSKGVMTDKEARKQRLGGEYLFEIW